MAIHFCLYVIETSFVKSYFGSFCSTNDMICVCTQWASMWSCVLVWKQYTKITGDVLSIVQVVQLWMSEFKIWAHTCESLLFILVGCVYGVLDLVQPQYCRLIPRALQAGRSRSHYNSQNKDTQLHLRHTRNCSCIVAKYWIVITFKIFWCNFSQKTLCTRLEFDDVIHSITLITNTVFKDNI